MATEFSSLEFREVSDIQTRKGVAGARRVIKDSRGFLWIGTTNGLYRYDGNHMKFYMPSDMGVNSGFVTALCEDSGGNVWVGTSRGLCYYNYDCDHFFSVNTYDDLHLGFVSSIVCDLDGVLWIDDCKGRIMSYANNQLTIFPNEFNGVTKRLGCDRAGRIYAACVVNDLMSFDKNTGILTPLDLGSFTGFFKGDELLAPVAHPKSEDIIYVASVNDGLCEVDLKDRTVKVVYKWQLGQRPYYISDTDNELLISTNHGVVVYNINTSEVELLNAERNDILSLPENDIKCSICDKNGDVWVCTSNNGVFYSGRGRLETECHNRTYDGVSLTGSMVSDFAEDSEGVIWITTQTKGLLKYSPADRTVKRMFSNLLPEYLNAVCVKDNHLYIGTSEGFWVLDKSGKYNQFYRSNRVESILLTNSGKILIGGVGGLLEFDRKNRILNVLLPMDDQGTVIDMVDGKNGHLWCQTYSAGVYVIDLTSGEIIGRYFNDAGTFDNDMISTMCIDENNEIWISGRESTLYVFEDIIGSPESSAKKYELNIPSVKLQSAVIDNQIAWLTTTNGLLSLSLQNGESSLFTEKDGLLNESFTKASLACADGRLALGSRDGFILLDITPQKQLDTPDVRITDFILHGQSHDYVYEKVLEKNVDITSKIILDHHHNSFALYFSDTEQSGNKVFCQLEGYESETVEVSSSGWKREFYGVRQGRYRLVISNHEPIDVIVKGPFLTSIPGIILMLCIVLVLMVMVGIIVYQRTDAIRLAELEKIEKARREEFLRNLDIVVERHISDESFNVDVIANDLFLSRSTLTRRMKNYINESPNDYIRRKRMILASELIKEGKYSITEISYKVGFAYPSYFTKCFKEHFGVTPSEYVK